MIKSINTANLTVNPVWLTKCLLQKYVEKFIEGKTSLSRQYALYDYLNKQTDKEYKNLLNEYVARQGLDTITFDEWKND